MTTDLSIHKYINTAGHVVEAVQFDGYNGSEIAEWTGGEYLIEGGARNIIHFVRLPTFFSGKVDAFPGDYVLKSTIGEFYTYSPEVMVHMFKLIVEKKRENEDDIAA